jgi:hypothetical protein
MLKEDLSILPRLRRCVLDMFEELPGRATGLGGSEMRILELISAGYVHPFDVFPDRAVMAVVRWLIDSAFPRFRKKCCVLPSACRVYSAASA